MHGNDLNNDLEHHLYEIFDKQKETTYKYGISCTELNEDGASSRADEQSAVFNRIAGWIRFISKVLIKNISGRKKAKEIEEQFIDEYELKHGKRPNGNPPENKLLNKKD
jgi:hypothetical protein